MLRLDHHQPKQTDTHLLLETLSTTLTIIVNTAKVLNGTELMRHDGYCEFNNKVHSLQAGLATFS
ncbi:hypothetical protein EGC77_14240 [Shewanella psychromarinicola]|uniref:Uncharacterized protein n=1 Tax=Shewanella psychromarinicola TaxID=2487742 RepID=A0A3N4E363_9GAMM|nr:hypothetical protein EGC77_14240 [Shewanella psychromarinicola]